MTQNHSNNAMELIVVLYDSILRFLENAKVAGKEGDANARRVAVKRALDIMIHLQARVRLVVGDEAAESLNEFYAAIFVQILQASQENSVAGFDSALRHVREVRDAIGIDGFSARTRFPGGSPR